MIEHPQGAKVLFVGECWGASEEKERRPFCGMAGNLLNKLLDQSGMPRETVAITNVLHERPANNNFKVYYEKTKGKLQPTQKLLDAYERLRAEIAFVKPNVIVPLGKEALKALTNLSDITSWRGSVIHSVHGKIIPTIHPAAILREWTLLPAVTCDFNRISKEKEYAEIKTKQRTIVSYPSYQEAVETLTRLQQSEWVAFDIETESNQITCISFSDRPDWSICIPFWFASSGSLWSEDEESRLWELIRGLLESETPKKIAHNGCYDVEVLHRNLGIRCKLHFDTMLGFHTCYPELPQGLDYLVSIYTDHPFYKFQRKTDQMTTLFHYNATDSLLTFECFEHIVKELNELGLTGFYHKRVHPLVDVVLAMQERGVGYDGELAKSYRHKYKRDLERLQHVLDKRVGHPLDVASPKQMKEWLYDELKLPKQYQLRKDTGEKTLAANEEALDELYKKTKNKAIRTVLSIRSKEKVLSTYLSIKLDEDKRIRCSYKISGTETGRMSSSKTLRGTGGNLQNIPSGIVKRLFISDPETILINADLSQAEARIVAYLANEQRLIRVFEEGGDIHRRNAATIFRVKEEDVTLHQRELAKRVVHASNYGMGPITFSKNVGVSVAEAKKLLNTYFATYPGIPLWQTRIKHEVQNRRVLVTPFGRRREFFNRWSESMVKEAYAYIPQSTVADIINQAMICLHNKGLELLLQVHDSIVVQCKTECAAETIEQIRTCMEYQLTINNRTMVIPADFKTGSNWQDMTKWRKI